MLAVALTSHSREGTSYNAEFVHRCHCRCVRLLTPVPLPLRCVLSEMSFTELGRELGKVWSGMSDKQKAVRPQPLRAVSWFFKIRGKRARVVDLVLHCVVVPPPTPHAAVPDEG